MVSDEGGPVSGISDEVIAAAVQQLPRVPTTTVGDSDRFVREIRHLVEERAQAGWPDESEANVAAFVMVQYPRLVKERYGIERVLDLRAAPQPLLGGLFFLSMDGTNGCTMPMPVRDADILDWLKDEGLQSSPVVLIYRGSQKMVSRASGTVGKARYDKIRDAPPAATLDELLEALQQFHVHNLLTPGICSKGVWEPGRAKDYIPGSDPEKSIQAELRVALRSWFRGELHVETEDSIPIGRIDVRILRASHDEGGLTYWAIIELKVVRSKWNAPKGKKASSVSLARNIEDVIEGLTQASSYKSNRLANEGLLEVYDLRSKKDTDIKLEPKVQKKWNTCQEDIAFNVRPLFGSPKEARNAGYS